MTGAREVGRRNRLLTTLAQTTARLSSRPGPTGALARGLTAPVAAGARWLSPGPGRWSAHEQALAGVDRVAAAAHRLADRRVLTLNAIAVGPGPTVSVNLSGPAEVGRQVTGLALWSRSGLVPMPTTVAADGDAICLVASVPAVARGAWRLEILGPARPLGVVVPDRRGLDRRPPSTPGPSPVLRIRLDRRHRLLAVVTGPARPGGARSSGTGASEVGPSGTGPPGTGPPGTGPQS